MTSLPLELQGQVAVFVALLCLCSGAVLWESAKRPGKWLGRITIAAGIFQLAAFSEYAVNQYEVVIARVSIPVVEVASGDNGRERTIERIDDGTGITIEREHIAGWSLVSASGRGHKAHRSMSRGAAGDSSRGAGTEGSNCESKGCVCGFLALPRCCNGRCPDCICNQLEITGNGRQF